MPLTSFYSALTGLSSNAQSISVIGNNLANMNTTAFKTSRTSFAELMGALGDVGTNGNPIQVGLGSTIAGITPVLTQGSIAYTGRSGDAAINGAGFFVVETPGGGQGFTRAGNFSFTNIGELINSDGFRILGYGATGGVIDTSGALTPIVISGSASLAPKPTTDIGINANLDSQTATGDKFSTGVQFYDSLGGSHLVTLTFTKTATGWDWAATLPAVDTGGAATAPPTSVGTGSISFDDKGVLVPPATAPTLTISGLADGAADMTVNFDLFDDKGLPRLTGFAATSAVSGTSQNGYSSGQLRGFSIDSKGIITGVFDNGVSQPLAQLALANFANVEGLQKYKGNTMVAVGSSGEPSIGVASTGGRGTISGSSLEASNVDIATEFTNLIVAQRGYQANSRVITTTDQLYQDAINLKQ
ncbi:MAG TPA: flagellar hook protein FlgE [Acidobacteriota bacterium]|nr:flagellar hook protein FlgE [Acidobacteriota bacterium]